MYRELSQHLSRYRSSLQPLVCLLALLIAVSACGTDRTLDEPGGGNDISDTDPRSGDGDDGNGSGSPNDESDAESDEGDEGDGDENDDGTGSDDPDDSDDEGEGGDDGDGGGEGEDDNGDDDGELTCPPPTEFDYSCDSGDTSTCPEGLCVFGLCIAPVVDPDRFDSCGDGVCDRCETASSCPADCASTPITTGAKEYDNDTTITVWLHGFSNQSGKLDDMVYGEARGCSGLEAIAGPFGINRPCGNTPEGIAAPNHFAAVEYYGRVPAPWLTPEDIDEIEQFPDENGPWGLQRYGLIAGKFIRHHMEQSGATHVNLACHSMGCLITRYLIENDIEGLASSNRLVRWVSSAGVVGGARLARLYDNPQIRDAAPLIGLELADFILMNPDWVQEHAARWDHRLQEGNNPLFRDMLIHHGGATKPLIDQAFNLPLLDLNNPGDEPNDGIMYTLDQMFHRQGESASRHTPSGRILSATHSLGYYDHMNFPSGDAFRTVAAAALFHRRKVIVKLQEITLHVDRESTRWTIPLQIETGEGPAEIVVESEVRFDPYVAQTLGRSVLVHESRIAHRTPELFVMNEGETAKPDYLIFAGPVFDDMTEFHLVARIEEVDRYPRMGVEETLINVSDNLVRFNGQVPLKDHVFEIGSDYATATISVEVVDMY